MEVLKEDPTKKWEYVVAKIQKEVSDFGNDWMKAMTIYFIVCLLGFGIAQFFDAFNNWIIGAKHLFQCWDIVWSEFIRYLNPLPKIDEVP